MAINENPINSIKKAKKLVLNFSRIHVFKGNFQLFSRLAPFVCPLYRTKLFLISYFKNSENLLSKNGIAFNDQKID